MRSPHMQAAHCNIPQQQATAALACRYSFEVPNGWKNEVVGKVLPVTHKSLLLLLCCSCRAGLGDNASAGAAGREGHAGH